MGVAALVGDLHIHVHTRLHYAVSALHTPSVVAQLGAVQRMRHCAYQLLRGIQYQFGVGVKGDHKLDIRHRPLPPSAYGLEAETLFRLRSGAVPEQQVVEMEYRTALALMAEPCVLPVAP